MARLSRVRAARWPAVAESLGAAALCLFGLVPPASATGASATAYIAAQARMVVRALHAYGQVEPIAVVPLRAVDPGTVQGLRVVPGSAVHAGQILARLGGSRAWARMVARQQALRGAEAQVHAAVDVLRIARRQLAAGLSTEQRVDAARRALAIARAAAITARARLREARNARVVRAPAAGTVLAVQAADGEPIARGAKLLTLQPAGRLWVRAQFYGADAARLRIGMQGRFQPSADARAVAVKVVAIAPAIARDGGVRIGLVAVAPTRPAWWVNGQWGGLTVDASARAMVLVPTRALILDRGQWWVLVHGPTGDTRQRVVPGPTVGWQTAIASGLRAGQQVVVTDAYLDYHRGIAGDYTPPD